MRSHSCLGSRSTRQQKEPSWRSKPNKVIDQLNRILECELAGVVRYTHYSMMIFGYSRIPIVAWFRERSGRVAAACATGRRDGHAARRASVARDRRLARNARNTTSAEILRETLQAEHNALGLYTKLLKLVEGRSVALEEYARDLIEQEEAHIDEIDKMLRKPGDTPISKEARDLD